MRARASCDLKPRSVRWDWLPCGRHLRRAGSSRSRLAALSGLRCSHSDGGSLLLLHAAAAQCGLTCAACVCAVCKFRRPHARLCRELTRRARVLAARFAAGRRALCSVPPARGRASGGKAQSGWSLEGRGVHGEAGRSRAVSCRDRAIRTRPCYALIACGGVRFASTFPMAKLQQEFATRSFQLPARAASRGREEGPCRRCCQHRVSSARALNGSKSHLSRAPGPRVRRLV